MKRKVSVLIPATGGTMTKVRAKQVRRAQVRALVYAASLKDDPESLVEHIAETFERWDKGEAHLGARVASAARWKKKRPHRPQWMRSRTKSFAVRDHSNSIERSTA
jgi:hypothetical protein